MSNTHLTIKPKKKGGEKEGGGEKKKRTSFFLPTFKRSNNIARRSREK